MDAKCPTEIAITDRREFELSNLGFLPLCHYKNTDYSVFFGAQTAQKPKKYDRPEATANAAISARLPYIMASSRFAHYLKVMARDKIGSFMEAADCERWLNRWIKNYVNGNENAGQEMKARYPAARGAGRGEGNPRQARLVQRGRLSASVAADGRADHQPAHGGPHPGRGGLIAARRVRRATRGERAQPRHGRGHAVAARCRWRIGAAPAVRDADAVGALRRQPRPRAGGCGRRVPRRAVGRGDRSAGSAPSAARGCASITQALRDALDRDIAAIDAMLSEQLDAILHHARLRRLEGTWRGLAWLVDGIELSQPAEDQDPQRQLAGDLPRPGTRHRVRSEPAVPQDLRGRVRHARRRAVRPADGRP